MKCPVWCIVMAAILQRQIDLEQDLGWHVDDTNVEIQIATLCESASDSKDSTDHLTLESDL